MVPMVAATTPVRRPGVGVAFGGGTARGLAHVGALKVLEAEGVRIQAAAGTSFGAIVAALHALGMGAVELERFVTLREAGEIWRQGLDFGLHRGSLVAGRRLARWLDRSVFAGATFADLRYPLVIACTDLATGRLQLLREGSIARAVQASCALPGVFAPVRLAGRTLIDGGFVEAVPFRALATLEPLAVLGLHAGVDPRRSAIIRAVRLFNVSRLGRRFQHATRDTSVEGPLGQMTRGMAIAFRSYGRGQHVPNGGLLVREAPAAAWWDFHRANLIVAAGERAMASALDAHPVFLARLRALSEV